MDLGRGNDVCSCFQGHFRIDVIVDWRSLIVFCAKHASYGLFVKLSFFFCSARTDGRTGGILKRFRIAADPENVESCRIEFGITWQFSANLDAVVELSSVFSVGVVCNNYVLCNGFHMHACNIILRNIRMRCHLFNRCDVFNVRAMCIPMYLHACNGMAFNE